MKKLHKIITLFILLALTFGNLGVTPVSAANTCAWGVNFAANGRYVSIAGLPTTTPGSTGTIEAWVNPTTIGGVNSIIRRTGSYNLYLASGNLYAEYWPSAPATTWRLYNTGTPIPGNTWTHVAMTWDASSNVKIYVNGVDVTPGFSSGSIGGSENFNIGYSTIYTNQQFLGSVDEVRVWNVTRTQTEIQNNRNVQLLGTETGLVGLYNFEEAAGTTANDSAVGDGTQNGTLTNGPTWVTPGAPITCDTTAPTVSSIDLIASYTGTGPGNFTVTFSEDVSVTGGTTGADSATNPDNYLLINKGTNGIADTASCAGGVATDDTKVTINSVSYDNTTFTSTVTLASTLPAGSYRLFVCGTTSIEDAGSNPLNGGSDYTFDFAVNAAPTALPATGFPMGRVTSLPQQPASKAYTSTDLVLEIPSLNQKMTIVGVPQTETSWDVTWLGNSAGWLNGSAFPTWQGNTVLTGHVWDSFNQPGPFAELKNLKYGDQVLIHAYGQTYTYEVRESKTYWAKTAVSKVFQHEELDWVTLMTCETYNPFNGDYFFRRAVRAVLVSVK